MSLEPSQPSTEATPHEPPGENERQLFLGRRYGIIALLCMLAGPLALLAALFRATEKKTLESEKQHGTNALLYSLVGPLAFLAVLLGVWGWIEMPPWSFWRIIVGCMLLFSPLCVIASIVHGIKGRNTPGRYYGYAGIVLSILYVLLMTSLIVNSIFVSLRG